MAASTRQGERRKRYERQPRGGQWVLTPPRLQLLRWIGELGFITVRQLSDLTGLSEQAVRRYLRQAHDHGIVMVHAVTRASLADPTAPVTTDLLHGSAPNIYSLTRQGRRLLEDTGWKGQDRPMYRFHPRASVTLGHELEVRDFRVWLERVSRNYPNTAVTTWRDGPAAVVDLECPECPSVLRPDAWWILRLNDQFLVGLLEVDRGTERGTKHWKEKLAGYTALFQSGRLRALTGYIRGRVLVVTPTPRRRDHLTELIPKHASPEVAARFWLAERSVLASPTLSAPLWRRPGVGDLVPLLASGQVPGSGGG